MPIISVRIPQLGEGLQEALLVELLKKPGDKVKRDDPIYVMETDKATTDVESPYEGRLIEWLVESGTVLSIGTEIAKMEVAEGVQEMSAGHGPSAGYTAESATNRSPAKSTDGTATVSTTRLRTDIQIPPRTRRYLKEKGLLNVADQIPSAGSKMMPDDVDAWIAAGGGNGTPPTAGGKSAPSAPLTSNDVYDVVPLPQSQITLNYRLSRGTQSTVPVTVSADVDWSALDSSREQTRASGGPTAFASACWCVVQAMKKFDRFRSGISPDGRSLKVFRRINLGVAVALPGDVLVTAVVRDACQKDQSGFFAALGQAIEKARDGQDQADESTTLTVSNIGKAGMRWGIPAIVTPAMATLAIGQAWPNPVPDGDSFKFRSTVIATLSFDHRVANGVGAASFLDSVRQEIEGFQLV